MTKAESVRSNDKLSVPADEIVVDSSIRFATEFTTVVREESDRMLRLAWLLTGDAHWAEDIVADAFATVYPRWRRGRVDDLRPYLRRAVVNGAKGALRRRARERAYNSQRNGDARGRGDDADRICEADMVHQALLALTSRQRAAIVLRYYDGLNDVAVAVSLGVSVGTAKTHLLRGLAALRRSLRPEHFEEESR